MLHSKENRFFQILKQKNVTMNAKFKDMFSFFYAVWVIPYREGVLCNVVFWFGFCCCWFFLTASICSKVPSRTQFKCSGSFSNAWSVPVFRACTDIPDNFTAVDDCLPISWKCYKDKPVKCTEILAHYNYEGLVHTSFAVSADLLRECADADPAASVLAP